MHSILYEVIFGSMLDYIFNRDFFNQQNNLANNHLWANIDEYEAENDDTKF